MLKSVPLKLLVLLSYLITIPEIVLVTLMTGRPPLITWHHLTMIRMPKFMGDSLERVSWNLLFIQHSFTRNTGLTFQL
jgi:hypothetical protein